MIVYTGTKNVNASDVVKSLVNVELKNVNVNVNISLRKHMVINLYEGL